MKFVLPFLSCSLFGSAKTLMDVYGGLPKIDSMTARSRKLPRRDSSRSSKHCDFPFDIVLVQDATGTFADDWPNLVEKGIPIALETLSKDHPGSRFGVVLHKDKPVEPLGVAPTPGNGYYSDFCVRTDTSLSTDLDTILDGYRNNRPYGGGDPPECQFVALLAASQLPFDWNPFASKLIMAITDAQPHFDLDGFNTMNLPSHPDEYDQEDPAGQCESVYYPSADQMKESLQSIDAYLGAAVYDGDSVNGLIYRSWQWTIRNMDQTDGFLKESDASSSNFAQNLLAIVHEIEKLECDLDFTEEPVTSTKEGVATSLPDGPTSVPTPEGPSDPHSHVTEPLLSTEGLHTSLDAVSTSHVDSPTVAAMSTMQATEEGSRITDGTEQQTIRTTGIATECHPITRGPTTPAPVTTPAATPVETTFIPKPSTTMKSCCGGGMGECMQGGKECMGGRMSMGHGMGMMQGGMLGRAAAMGGNEMQGGMMQGGMMGRAADMGGNEMQGGMMQGGMMGRAADMGGNEFRVALPGQNAAIPVLYPVLLEYPYDILVQ
eukprot:Protomagalhaensia_sp_Gyna_25__1235@NODE_1616_length_1687_cov_964_170510_g1322_i0_p1_GENE_NODE_1616_length_1687_cov_964_170510_g1322_i0NODE_1616_length_1687_cov_964_170510_g1322_i0_p1_ORF_typecomplete_len546_score78_62Integrin_beta/PF00362_18/1_5e19VWA/PF00092_28/0_0086potato_inhibit/PF00280_18/0_19_NODE_1616_length_1687_cov_964_170510_g1322_i031640